MALQALKQLQEILGDFQDCTVQEAALMQFRSQMQLSENAGVEQTLLAMTAWGNVLAARRVKARADFTHRFNTFATAQNRAVFTRLFRKN